MIFNEKRKLLLRERKILKDIKDNKTEIGVVIPNVLKNTTYDAMIVIPFKWENDTSKIIVFETETNKDYEFPLFDKIYGNYELAINNDVINLTIN